MPLNLTTPISTGDLDPNGPYQQVKIVSMVLDVTSGAMLLSVEKGNTVNGTWIPGILPRQAIEIVGENYTILISESTPEQGETTYAAVSRGLYEYLIDTGVFVGSIA